MSYKKSILPHQQDRLRLLSFSPDDHLHNQSPITKKSSSLLKSHRLYQVYHNQKNATLTPNKQLPHKESRNPQNHTQNPQSTRNNQKLKLVDQLNNQFRESKIRAKSSQEIKPKKYFMSIDLPQNSDIHSKITRQNHNVNQEPSRIFFVDPNLNNTISHHTNYVSSKQAFRNLSKSRIQEEKDLTFLSRTFQNIKKSQQQTKKLLIDSFTKRLQRQSRQKSKQQAKRKHEEWLENQKNQNSTKKYMNHLLKYHAKKNLIDKNTEHAQQMRSRLKSQQSVKSQRSLIISRQKKQNAYLMKVENSQNIHNAKIRTMSRIKSKSNSVRNEMAKAYEYEGELEAWRIQQIDERSKFMLSTIEKSKKNKELLQKVLKDSRNLDSTALFQALTNNLTKPKSSSRVDHK